MKKTFLFAIISIILFNLHSHVQAQSVKPDIRNYDAWVDTKLMPSIPCYNKTPEEWVAGYVGFNQLAGNNMKFSDYLFGMADQVDRAAKRLAPKVVSDYLDRARDEQGNPVSWVGEICWYQPDLKPPIIGETIIESETPISQIYKKLRDGHAQLSAFNALYHIPLSGGKYNLQKPALSPDPNRQSKCPAVPTGAPQSPTVDKGQGKNIFNPSDPTLICLIDEAIPVCKCKMTKMYIRTDSFIPYNMPATCLGAGCTEEQITQVDPKSGPTELEKNQKGWMNAVVRPGLMDIIIVMVEKLTGTITGKVAQQTTVNNVNEPVEPSSYYTTMGQEMSMKFTNCSLFPYAKRAEMPECNTNWLSGIMASSVTNEIRGTLSQNTVELNESSPSSTLIP